MSIYCLCLSIYCFCFCLRGLEVGPITWKRVSSEYKGLGSELVEVVLFFFICLDLSSSKISSAAPGKRMTSDHD